MRGVPRIDRLRYQVIDMAGDLPFYSIITREIVDGRNITARANEADNSEYILFEQLGWEWQLRSQMLARTAWTVLSNRGVTEADFAELIRSPFISPDATTLINDGLKRYISQDFVGALHILIPQFECCIRGILEFLGRPTSKIKDQKKRLSMERTLDDMLRDKALQIVLGEDLCYLYRFIFSDQRGWNLRNNICHGLSPIEVFNEPCASSVVFAILYLGSFTPNTEEK